MDRVQLSQGQRSTSRRQFTFYHYFSRNFWYSFYKLQKDERLSRPWSHPMVLKKGLLDWESSAQDSQHRFVKKMIAQYSAITICSYHVTCTFQSESIHYNYNYLPVWLNGLVFVCNLNGCLFVSHYSYLFSYKLIFVYMVTLVINNEKCLTSNLSKEPKFILIFLGKSCTTLIHSNFISNQKKLHFCDTFVTIQKQALSFNSCIFVRSHSNSVTCYYVTALTS